MASPRLTLKLEKLEARDVPSASSLVGIVRDGSDLFLAGDQVNVNAEQVRHLGQAGGTHLAGDWNGDTRTDLVFVRANAEGGLSWAIDTNGDGQADTEHRFGLAGDTPFLGDWNGDRTIDVGVARKNPQSGALDWYLDTTRQVYANPRARQFGLATDAPVVGDWDGNGTTDLGVTRPDGVTGLLQWSLDTSGDAWPEVVRGYGLVSTNDVPVAGDWNGDGKTDLGVTRNNAATGLKEWHLDTSGDRSADIVQAFGFARDTPVVGAWKTLAPLVVASPPAPPVSSPPNVVARPTATSPPTDTSSASPRDQVMKASKPYKPLQGANINFRMEMGIFYSTTSGSKKAVTVTVHLTKDKRDQGDVKIRLYWAEKASLSGKKWQAGEDWFTANRFAPPMFYKFTFSRDKVSPKPASARYLIAVVNPDRDTVETTYEDNAVALDLVTSKPAPMTTPAAQPRTFVFLFGGFATSSGAKGMSDLAASIEADPVLKSAKIHVLPGGLTGPTMEDAARNFVETKLREAGAAANDRVVLIGHSFGGEVARRVASDVRRGLDGAQPATALVTIDPIDFLAVTTSAVIDQSGNPKDAPAGIALGKILSIVQRHPDSRIKGYHIKDVPPGTVNHFGGDGKRGTDDDLTHTSIDDSPFVYRKVIAFLKGL